MVGSMNKSKWLAVLVISVAIVTAGAVAGFVSREPPVDAEYEKMVKVFRHALYWADPKLLDDRPANNDVKWAIWVTIEMAEAASEIGDTELSLLVFEYSRNPDNPERLNRWYRAIDAIRLDPPVR